MVRIERIDNDFVFEVVGFHKILTFVNKLIIPAHHIVSAYPNEQRLDFLPGLRLLGTGFPGLISAGTYWIDGDTIFCDVVNYENSIAIELRDEHYSMLIVEVEEPLEAIRFLTGR
ncbi:hypothetical protein POV26_00980 [Aequorivita todarodis]|uniref:hypothetical protein n=1 Tax=Aequorivita todarodis TaxID=2036821 RepID=UPI002350977A|nr:hypothetical protein [Aequorivita todarodis]MDC7999603.1 hypothetical protein [Aequorivita todarodis]